LRKHEVRFRATAGTYLGTKQARENEDSAMPFEYGCFVSYAHPGPGGQTMTTFVEDLVQALESELDPYMGNPVYFDKKRLKPSYEYDPALSHGLCASACWILVYAPLYRKREYCLREYNAMQALQAQRRRELGRKLPKHRSMIVPILVRGDQREFPEELRKTEPIRFDQVTLAESTISDRPEEMAALRDLAAEISEIHELGEELNHDCETFELPPPNGDFKPLRRPFPGDPRATDDAGGDE
jgi:hypothetical protein